MSDDFPPFFEAMRGSRLCRVYVTSSDVIFIELGVRVSPHVTTSGLAGGVATLEKQREYEREIEYETALLAKRNAEGLRIYAKANNRGYVAESDSLEAIYIDYVGKWKRFLFMTPSTALIVQHKKKGNLTYTLPTKKDLIVAIYQLQRLLGDDFEVRLPEEDYKKALKKYKKMQGD